eukprot:CAMPEP_0197312718 /NCGR_PEP_ID=MMETSP0891-20130614/23066_1 /TAXON_ID=44058 ORGANISM="Aureoumbra lagunensis, Strain CCMP1510" /NCGR_SAMPLE_ID=MMETSP0891 /ASSEMBLY_ACC=CAM_ASM_000534 /LENGTH=553 /DNA_ID=CAMNT_0042800095 /DNA_START=114 /DNA_END=1775 /DNA_ORIENTATION=-
MSSGVVGSQNEEEETMTARELRKELRRLEHASKGSGRTSARTEEKEKILARLKLQEEKEKVILDIKSNITIKRKALKALDDQGDERMALKREIDELNSRYESLTGEKTYTKKRKRASSHQLETDYTRPENILADGPSADQFEQWLPRDYFKFEVVHESTKSRARVCRITTPHGVIETPCFVPVGTNAAAKCVSSEQCKEVQLMFCNTYHLLVHPGSDVIEAAGGLHSFMNRHAPIITDSGGFQVFSLAAATEDEDGPELKMKRVRRTGKNSEKTNDKHANNGQLLTVNEHGTSFRSYLDGSIIQLTPESSVAAQKKLGADIIIPLDELPPYHVTRERLAASVALSHRWMARSLAAHLKDKRKQAMYAVIHGGVDRQLRSHSVEYLTSLPFDGFAVGGSLGKDKSEMFHLLNFLMPLLPRNKPNHVLGIADPDSAKNLVPLGVDTMDSCNPTRVARHGTLFVSTANDHDNEDAHSAPSSKDGILRIKQGRFQEDFRPIDPFLPVDTLPGYSRAYLHHLFKQNEPLALTLASIHNIKFMNFYMADLRKKIMNNEI